MIWKKLFSKRICLVFIVSLQLCMRAAQGLSCRPCNPINCVEPTCRGGVVRDPCECCKVCAKLDYEECGGMFDVHGICDKNLTCVIQMNNGDLLTGNENGVCKPSNELTSADKCHESSYFGCDLVDGYCDCGRQIACSSPFQFQSLQACSFHHYQTNGWRKECADVHCAVHQSRSCPEDSQLVEGHFPEGECCPTPSRCECMQQRCTYNLCRSGMSRVLVASGSDEPGSCCDVYQCVNEGDVRDCTNVKCSVPPLDSISCPPDSVAVRNPLSPDTCCPGNPICQCRRGDCPSPPSCRPGMSSRVHYRGNQKPGSCCDEYVCAYGKVFVGCSVNGTHYEHGAVYQSAKCTLCECVMGLSQCYRAPCPHLTCTDITMGTDGCCPICLSDVHGASPDDPNPPCRSGNKTYKFGDTWTTDVCTHCACAAEGKVQCKAAFCEEPPTRSDPPTCPALGCILSPSDCKYGFVYSQDVCRTCQCRTDILGCWPPSDCFITCPFGYVVDQSGCNTCRCRQTKCKELPPSCQKQCPYGFKLNKKNCPRCKCRSCPATNSCTKQCSFGLAQNAHGCSICKCKANSTIDVKPVGAHMCTDPVTRGRYDDGEVWSGGPCRSCLCRGGEVVCDVIQCPVPNCARPMKTDAACCPVCNETETKKGPLLLSCQNPDGESFVEGEIWQFDKCTTCTCHSGHVMCTSPVCPPMPCDHPVHEEGRCCPRCFDHPEVEDSQTRSCRLDGGGALQHGEEFRNGSCTSCICRNGSIKCFTELCPDAGTCDHPVVRRGQCCPMCLGQPRLQRACLTSDGSTRAHAEEWNKTEGACASCVCEDGSVSCLEPQCPAISEKCRRVYKSSGACCSECVILDDNKPSVSHPPDGAANTQTVAIALTIIFLVLVAIFAAVTWFLVKRGCPKTLKYKRGKRSHVTNDSFLHEIKSNGTSSLGGKSSGTARSDMTSFFSSSDDKISGSRSNGSADSRKTPSTSSDEDKSSV